MELKEDGIYSAVPFRKDDQIIFVRWYGFSLSKRKERGDRFYMKRLAIDFKLFLNRDRYVYYNFLEVL